MELPMGVISDFLKGNTAAIIDKGVYLVSLSPPGQNCLVLGQGTFSLAGPTMIDSFEERYVLKNKSTLAGYINNIVESQKRLLESKKNDAKKDYMRMLKDAPLVEFFYSSVYPYVNLNSASVKKQRDNALNRQLCSTQKTYASQKTAETKTANNDGKMDDDLRSYMTGELPSLLPNMCLVDKGMVYPLSVRKVTDRIQSALSSKKDPGCYVTYNGKKYTIGLAQPFDIDKVEKSYAAKLTTKLENKALKGNGSVLEKIAELEKDQELFSKLSREEYYDPEKNVGYTSTPLGFCIYTMTDEIVLCDWNVEGSGYSAKAISPKMTGKYFVLGRCKIGVPMWTDANGLHWSKAVNLNPYTHPALYGNNEVYTEICLQKLYEINLKESSDLASQVRDLLIQGKYRMESGFDGTDGFSKLDNEKFLPYLQPAPWSRVTNKTKLNSTIKKIE